jgi:hypothetical protein
MRKNDDVLYATQYLEDFPFFHLFPVYWAPDTLKILKKRPENCVNPLFVSKDSLFQVVGAEKSQYLCGFPRLSLIKRRFTFLINQIKTTISLDNKKDRPHQTVFLTLSCPKFPSISGFPASAVVCPSAIPSVESFMNRILIVAKIIRKSCTRLGLAIYIKSSCSLSYGVVLYLPKTCA